MNSHQNPDSPGWQPTLGQYPPEYPTRSQNAFTGATMSSTPGDTLGNEPPTPGNRAIRPRRRVGLMLGSLSLAALLGAGTGIGSYAVLADGGLHTAPVSVTTTPAKHTAALDGTVEAAAAAISPSVVTITVTGSRSSDVGSGVIVDTKGHVLTNRHVVEAAAQSGTIAVTLSDGSQTSASLVGTSDTTDLAVIKIADSAQVSVADLTPATFAESSSLAVGQAVVAVGSPLGLSETVTSGVVSNTARPVRSGLDNNAVYQAVQTDTAINPGNSGGPLVDLNGSVVGINSSIATTGEDSGSIGIGFAIPADVASRTATELISSGHAQDSSLGVSVAPDDATGATAVGATVHKVTPGGAADQAGLKAGDVITGLADVPTPTADALIAAVRFNAPGTQVTVDYQREGRTDTAQVTLGTA